MFRILVILSLCFGLEAATTHYIDFVGGSDANDGLSTGTAWQHHPRMTNVWAGTYVHAAGDAFLFKGGVTWDSTCFPIQMANGGSGTNAVDYYGYTNNWYAGSKFSPPVFDMGGQLLPNVGGFSIQWKFSSTSHSFVTIDGIVFTGFYWDGTSGTPIVINCSTATNLTIANCVFTNWTHATYASGARDGFTCIYGSNAASGNQGVHVEHCTFDGGTAGADSGMAVYIANYVENCTIRNMGNALVVYAPGWLTNNLIENINASFDSARHPNGIETIGVTGKTSYIVNNYLNNCAAICCFVSDMRTNEVYYVMDNSFVYTTNYPVILLKCNPPYLDNSNGGKLYAARNYFQPWSGSSCFIQNANGGYTLELTDLSSNVCVQASGDVFNLSNSGSGTNLVANTVYTNLNLVPRSTMSLQ